nr:SCP2 sterol-binding domain-containing protein [Clostridia bacterium]
MTYEEIVKEAQKLVSKADASGISEHLAVQYNVTGEGEGAFYMEVKDGKVEVQPYDYKDRDILVTADGQTILDMMSGKLDVVAAYLTHKISAEGDLGKADILKKLISSSKKAEKTAAKAAKKTVKNVKKTAKK